MPIESLIVSGATPTKCERFRRQLAVCGRGGVGDERLGVAHVHQAFEELDRVEEPDPGVVPAGDAKGDDRGAVALEVALGKVVVREARVSEIAQPFDARVSEPGTALWLACSTRGVRAGRPESRGLGAGGRLRAGKASSHCCGG